MDKLTPAQVWAAILAVASAIVLLSNAVEKIVKAVQAAKSPNEKLDVRVTALENWRKDVDKRHDKNLRHFEDIDASNRVTQLALLALLDHGIDGNNIDQMQHAKEELQTHLINR